MPLTRKLLKSMGISDEQADTIEEAYTATVDGLKSEIEKYRADSARMEEVQKELNDLKAKGDGGWEEKYNQEHAAFEQLKSDIAAKETQAAREKAVRAWYESRNITGKSLDIAMRGSRDEIAAVDLDKDGSIRDTKALEALIKGDFAGLVTKTETRGADTATPPDITGDRPQRQDNRAAQRIQMWRESRYGKIKEES